MAKVLSNQEKIDEIVKCGKNPDYFIKKYVKIQHPKRGSIPFELYPFQGDCLTDFQNHRFNIVVKSRQLGLSTLAACYAVWLALFKKDKNILIIATKLKVAQNFIDKVKTALNNLPKWLWLTEIQYETKQYVSFTNGSKIQAIPTSEDAGRSEALSLCIIDECAFIRNFDEIWTAIYSTLSTGGNAILLSTPNGVGDKYHELCVGAQEGTNDFNLIKLPWTVHPERDEEWFSKETKQMSAKAIAQELMCDFAASGDTFLESMEIEKLSRGIKPPLEKTGPNYDLWIWDYYNPTCQYVISADVSRGDAQDFSTFQVFNTKTGEQVAEYKGKIKPDQFAIILSETGKKYGNALICVEKNSYGYTVNLKLSDFKYPNLYYENEKHKIEANFMGQNDVGKIGFDTNPKTRPQILTKLEEILRKNSIKFYSYRFFEEMKTFVWRSSKAQAQKGKTDDLIMAAAIGCWLFDVESDSTVEDKFDYKYMLEAFSVNSTQDNLTPKIRDYANNRYSVPEKNDSIGPYKEFDWIFDKF